MQAALALANTHTLVWLYPGLLEEQHAGAVCVVLRAVISN